MTEYNESGNLDKPASDQGRMGQEDVVRVSLDDIFEEQFSSQCIKAFDAIRLSDNQAEIYPIINAPSLKGSPDNVVQAISLEWIRVLSEISILSNMRGTSSMNVSDLKVSSWTAASIATVILSTCNDEIHSNAGSQTSRERTGMGIADIPINLLECAQHPGIAQLSY